MSPSDALRAERDELLEALKLADGLLSGANMNVRVVERKVRAAIARSEAFPLEVSGKDPPTGA